MKILCLARASNNNECGRFAFLKTKKIKQKKECLEITNIYECEDNHESEVHYSLSGIDCICGINPKYCGYHIKITVKAA